MGVFSPSAVILYRLFISAPFVVGASCAAGIFRVPSGGGIHSNTGRLFPGRTLGIARRRAWLVAISPGGILFAFFSFTLLVMIILQ